MSSTLAIPPWTLIRQEKHGGTIYNTKRNRLYRVDSELFAILFLCQMGISRDQILRSVTKCNRETSFTELESLISQLIEAELLVETAGKSSTISIDEEVRFRKLWFDEDNAVMPNIPGPILVYLEVTHKCNLLCTHCYNNSGPFRSDELSNEKIRSLFEEFEKMGVFYVSITGGEPLVRADIYDLIEEARQKEIGVILATNGTLITSPVAERLASLDISQVQVSLDASDSKTHNQFRGKPYAYQRAVRGIRLLVERGVTVTISCVVNQLNFQSLPEMVDTANSLGADYFRVINLMSVGRGEQIAKDNESVYSMRQKIDDQIDLLARQYAGSINILTEEADNNLQYECGSGVSFCSISATGKVTPCSFSPTVSLGNVNSSEFISIWENSAVLCEYRRRKTVEMENGTLMNCSEYGCQAAKVFAETK